MTRLAARSYCPIVLGNVPRVVRGLPVSSPEQMDLAGATLYAERAKSQISCRADIVHKQFDAYQNGE